MENYGKKYTLLVRGKRVSVTKEVYKAYYKCRDREKYLDELSEENNISLEGCIENGVSVEYIISTMMESLEDAIIKRMMIAKLYRCLEMLDKSERTLIEELYLRGKSERQFSAETGSPYMTIHDRKIKILGKIKKLMEK
ncbi:sigma-70 family RNA polymerase sigma factor [Phosphitispora fastidiosa]|uniref:sigma-70 family RNA polymerase sigma factor n=1 Tax=Phosphitispora fastidiosa TaxID=2837202 RepID=UPI001E299750|nr:sigma-70 family RNA polymerase sigma factor [Phosphitispora fastidiosa]MBU7008703.1 DNA-directed RNA polymerase specialized sigma24 family protein [Phosphitispora fastidiosa]